MAALILLCIAVTLWYLLDGMRAREIATAVAKQYCRQAELQFLDGTVNLRSLALRRTSRGPAFRRTYEFQYTRDDNVRHFGAVVMLGRRMENFILNQDQHIDQLPG